VFFQEVLKVVDNDDSNHHQLLSLLDNYKRLMTRERREGEEKREREGKENEGGKEGGRKVRSRIRSDQTDRQTADRTDK
jgi:hypothetical protein